MTIAKDPLVTDVPPVTRAQPVLGRVLIVTTAVLFGAGTLGTALSPYLAVRHPLILVALNPWSRHVVLVAPHAPMLPLLIIATLRGLCSCIVAYEITRYYGPRGRELFERRSLRIGRAVRSFERAVSKAAPLFLVLSPGPVTTAVAALSGTTRPVIWSLSAVGLAAWNCANYKIGDWLEPWTQPILEFIQRHLLSTTLTCAVLVFGYHWVMRSRRLRQQRKEANL